MNQRLMRTVVAAAFLIVASTALADHTHHRAGNPERVACYAKPSESSKGDGGFIGGGRLLGGHGPTIDDGTWGWDTHACPLPRRVFLRWFHKDHEGGKGAYKTDGPHVPNIFAVKLPKPHGKKSEH